MSVLALALLTEYRSLYSIEVQNSNLTKRLKHFPDESEKEEVLVI